MTIMEVMAMKKSYEKPAVAEVKLAADEAVLQNCKVTPDGLEGGTTVLVCRETGEIQTFGS